MIRFTTGNLFESDVEALVNTVNTVGVMGKGVALQFKNRFPENYKLYVQACKRGEVQTGKMFVTHLNRMENPLWIINFPTKKNWIHRSSYEFIAEGLTDLARILEEKKIKSVAIPPLGAGQGGLDWSKVKELIVTRLQHVDCDVIVFESGGEATAPNTGQDIHLTKARALILSLIEKYEVLGYETSILEIQKLAYFLQRAGQSDLNLRYQKYHYGPYAHNLQHLLEHLERGFLRTERPIMDSKPSDLVELNKEKVQEVHAYISAQCTAGEKRRLKLVQEVIEGYETPFGLELLASVDWILQETPKNIAPDVEYVRNQLWTERKSDNFTEFHIQRALERLSKFRDIFPVAA